MNAFEFFDELIEILLDKLNLKVKRTDSNYFINGSTAVPGIKLNYKLNAKHPYEFEYKLSCFFYGVFRDYNVKKYHREHYFNFNLSIIDKIPLDKKTELLELFKSKVAKVLTSDDKTNDSPDDDSPDDDSSDDDSPNEQPFGRLRDDSFVESKSSQHPENNLQNSHFYIVTFDSFKYFNSDFQFDFQALANDLTSENTSEPIRAYSTEALAQQGVSDHSWYKRYHDYIIVKVQLTASDLKYAYKTSENKQNPNAYIKTEFFLLRNRIHFDKSMIFLVDFGSMKFNSKNKEYNPLLTKPTEVASIPSVQMLESKSCFPGIGKDISLNIMECLDFRDLSNFALTGKQGNYLKNERVNRGVFFYQIFTVTDNFFHPDSFNYKILAQLLNTEIRKGPQPLYWSLETGTKGILPYLGEHGLVKIRIPKEAFNYIRFHRDHTLLPRNVFVIEEGDIKTCYQLPKNSNELKPVFPAENLTLEPMPVVMPVEEVKTTPLITISDDRGIPPTETKTDVPNSSVATESKSVDTPSAQDSAVPADLASTRDDTVSLLTSSQANTSQGLQLERTSSASEGGQFKSTPSSTICLRILCGFSVALGAVALTIGLIALHLATMGTSTCLALAIGGGIAFFAGGLGLCAARNRSPEVNPDIHRLIPG